LARIHAGRDQQQRRQQPDCEPGVQHAKYDTTKSRELVLSATESGAAFQSAMTASLPAYARLKAVVARREPCSTPLASENLVAIPSRDAQAETDPMRAVAHPEE
jgi:hypothetical protein